MRRPGPSSQSWNPGPFPLSSVRPVPKRLNDAKVADVDGSSQRRAELGTNQVTNVSAYPRCPRRLNEARATQKSHNHDNDGGVKKLSDGLTSDNTQKLQMTTPKLASN